MQPALELASGRSVEALSAYALTPDSLAICSLALMFTLRQSFGFFLPALLWLLFAASTYYAMGDPMFWYLFLVLLAIASAMLTDRYHGSDTAR